MKVFLCCLLVLQVQLNVTHASEKISDTFGQLTAIYVPQSIRPKQESELSEAIANWNGKISIGDARYSMGG